MSDRNLEPLPSDISELFEHERARSVPPTDEQLRVLARVQGTLGLGGGASPGSGNDGGGPGGATGAPSAVPPVAAAVPAGLLLRSLSIGIAGFVLGAFVGAAGYARLRPLPPAVVTEAAPAPAEPIAAPPPVAEVSPAPEPAQPPVVASSPAASTSAPAGARSAATPGGPASAQADVPGRDVDLAAERALLEIARTALARGQSARALEALQRHATEFPRGRLGEEREALSIQALLAAGRRDEARARAERFEKTFPRSLLLPAIDAALAPKP